MEAERIGKIGPVEVCDVQNRIIRMQSEVIDELFRLLMQHTGTAGLGGVTEKIREAVELNEEIGGETGQWR